MIIKDILAVRAMGAYYYDDLTALQATPLSVAERYTAEPRTLGFRRAREVAEALSVGLVLEDGPSTSSGCQVAWGDCVAVEFSGKAGRFPLFRAEEGLASIQQMVAPILRDRKLTSFRELAAEVDALVENVRGDVGAGFKPTPTSAPTTKLSRHHLLPIPARLLRSDDETRAGVGASFEPALTERVTVERRLHTALRYGVSQARLAAVALARGVTMAEVVAQEYGLPTPTEPVPIHAQCGADRYAGADKMIARRVASLPHTLVDNTPEHLGSDGQVLARYAHWLRERIRQLAGENYRPTIHLDVHGALGQIYDNNLGKILGYLYRLEQAVAPYPLVTSSPVD